MNPRRLVGTCLAVGIVLAAGPPLVEDAAAEVAAGRFRVALERLRAAFEAGYPTPASVLADARFAPLREDAASRGPWRDLMRAHVRESRITMVPAGEPGQPMLVVGRVVRAGDGSAVAGAVIEMYHTDATGNYEPGKSAGAGANPRLFGFVRTGPDGGFEVRTIRPAPYPGARPGFEHVHFLARAPGYRALSDEFRPYTHPADDAERHAARAADRPTSQVRERDGLLVCEVTIVLDPAS